MEFAKMIEEQMENSEIYIMIDKYNQDKSQVQGRMKNLDQYFIKILELDYIE
eukprot:CAMPEP_0114576094 /NCGR_PEP_ID=MMETSP0125-20121206/885_1 /TAXON_ID=485358 ORGANISM="Aristerostoma sp., Strain ATCC 50986" /NCGR_SAMPLE_ID=MMETSP0125 /ASSEMBLY_ACC=CAM_ASM_000245 /LENGTH=51 /DNA_ID=CAMNT_0001764323 /DNA_START=828 /DNA_END=983 /DNA_ORIENTATION=-